MDGVTSTQAQRWLARLSFVLAGLAIVILLVFAGLKSLAMVAADPGRRRRGVDRDVGAGCLRGLPWRAPCLGASGSSGSAGAEAAGDWAGLRYVAGMGDLRRGHRIDWRERDGQEEEEGWA